MARSKIFYSGEITLTHNVPSIQHDLNIDTDKPLFLTINRIKTKDSQVLLAVMRTELAGPLFQKKQVAKDGIFRQLSIPNPLGFIIFKLIKFSDEPVTLSFDLHG